MSIRETEFPVNTLRDDNLDSPIAWSICDLPQRVGVAYGIQLIYADGRTGQIAMSSRSHRGIRQQVRTHPRYCHLPERVVVAGGAVVATITQVRGGGRR
jgi:hypothetical protein